MMKDEIISKSEDLFLTLGFKNVTMDDIASVMGISKKTIYTHFSNKIELVRVVTFSILEHIYQEIERINKSAVNPIEELYQIKMFLMHYLRNESGSASSAERQGEHSGRASARAQADERSQGRIQGMSGQIA